MSNKYHQWMWNVLGALLLTAGFATSANATPIAVGRTIGWDIKSSGNITANYTFAGIEVPANSTWNVTQSDMGAGTIVDVSNVAVDGISTARFGTTWSDWGSIPLAGETNAVTEDYLHDSNGSDEGGHNAVWDINGLDDSLTYNIVLHAARLSPAGGGGTGSIEGAVVTIGANSITIPKVAAGGTALWPNGGFALLVTSAEFTGVSTNGSGQIRVSFDKIAGDPILFLGAELEVVPEPNSFALLLFGGVGLWLMRNKRS